jgi:hypothetical protein
LPLDHRAIPVGEVADLFPGLQEHIHRGPDRDIHPIALPDHKGIHLLL